VAIGDLNGDGKPDLATANFGSNTVSVLLGNGDGTFGARTDYGTGSSPHSVVIRDLNGDGTPDLATADLHSNTVSVLLGNGDGSFGVKTDFGTGGYPASVAIGDLNGDGMLDLAVTNFDLYSSDTVKSQVSVLLNTGDVPTAIAVSLQSKAATSDRASLVWYAAGGAGVGATVYRRTERGDWQPIGTVMPDGVGRMTFVDRHVSAGTQYGYRLGIVEAGHEVFYGETWLTIPLKAEFALRGLQPNPAGASVSVAFSLPDDRPARLELFDVRGRRVLEREVGSLGPGTHVVGLEEGLRLPAGLYLTRLTHGGRGLTVRGVIVR
jgi:hypothetical protein